MFPRHDWVRKPHHLHWQPNLLPLKQAYKKRCFQSCWHFSSAVHPICDPIMFIFCNLAALMLLLTFQSPGESLPQSVNVNCVNVLLCMFNLCWMCFIYFLFFIIYLSFQWLNFDDVNSCVIILTINFVFYQKQVHAGKIIGGHEVNPHKRSYMVFLRLVNKADELKGCGGFLIREDFVMTAAHCQAKSVWHDHRFH